jgi:hypothetical protein
MTLLGEAEALELPQDAATTVSTVTSYRSIIVGDQIQSSSQRAER